MVRVIFYSVDNVLILKQFRNQMQMMPTRTQSESETMGIIPILRPEAV